MLVTLGGTTGVVRSASTLVHLMLKGARHLSLIGFTLSFGGGCSNLKDHLWMGVRDEDICAAGCAGELPPFPMNLVVLTDRSDAPQKPATEVTSCDTADTGWPCVEPNSLAGYFITADGDPVCTDPGDPNTCVRFELGAQAFRIDLDASSAATDCDDALAYADSPLDADGNQPPDVNSDGVDASDWYAALNDAVEFCSDPMLFNPDMINVFLVDNQVDGDNSWNNPCDGCTMPVNFIDVDRLLDRNPATLLEFAHAAAEHEMGHGFGLDHACADNFPNSSGDPSNIMQTGPDTCCCESALTNEYDTGGPWSEICVDCSADDGTLIAATCNDTPGAWDDPDCLDASAFSIGNRADGFTNDVPSDWNIWSPPGQIDRILEHAFGSCTDQCVNVAADEDSADAVSNEMPCHAGSGRFELFPLDRVDRDGDGLGFMELVPIALTGNHLGRLSEITSVSIVDLGGASRLVLPTVGYGWRFSPGDPDTLSLVNMLRFDSTHMTAAPALGVARTGFLWATDAVSMSSDDWEWPVVDLVWGCNNDYQAADVRWHTRPPNAYRLHTSDIDGTLVQEILVRPDLTAMQVWFELRGYPRAADRIDLSQGANGTYTWSFSRAGLAVSGWLKPTGQPTGSTLQVHVDSASFGNWSLSNITLPALQKLP